VLRDAGAQVRTFGVDEELQRSFAEGLRPDLLVLDLRLEGELRGVDIANRSRARLSPPPPVIIITGDTAADTLAFLSESGFTWLIKPVDRAALTRAAAAQVRKQLV
jgi:DNA-binding response OmpR family regulator